ncbi:MAG: YceI family protein [Pseudomonadota bacterium]
MNLFFKSAFAFALMTGIATAQPATYKLDPAHTTIGFWIMHIGYAKTFGQFTEVEGSYVFDEEARTLSDVSVTVPTASVFTANKARDGHVKNADFLDVGQFPEMTFTASGGEVTGDQTGTVTGDLTLLGVTKPITLDVTWNKSAPYPFGHKKHTMGVSARGVVKRSEFGMTYALGGIVGDEVEIVIEMEAIREE